MRCRLDGAIPPTSRDGKGAQRRSASLLEPWTAGWVAQKGSLPICASRLRLTRPTRQVDIEDVLQEPTPAEVVRANLAEMEKSEVDDWHRALEALRGVNARPSPAA